MLAAQQQLLTSLLHTTLDALLPGLATGSSSILLERPKNAAHGDISTNIALQMAKLAQRPPRELAQAIVEGVCADPRAQALIETAEIAGPGFINFSLTLTARQAVLAKVLQEKEDFGRAPATGKKVLVEFVSANPTGPLHVGHARQAALGDAICRLLASQGDTVTREFYYNDAGNQIHNLALSVQARARGIAVEASEYPVDGYKGEYIAEIAQAFLAGSAFQSTDGETIQATAEVENLEAIRRFAVAYLRREQDRDLQVFGLAFDHYFLESSLYTDGQVAQTVAQLTASGYTYEAGGALWLRTTALECGDDKDRVMRKREGGYTYFVPDVAYHLNKWARGFVTAINIQGSDHHGTVARVRAGLRALKPEIPPDYPTYVLHKMVKVMRGQEEVKISKRAGNYVTMRELIDWVGRDAVRYFLIQRRADTEFIFDIDLARSKSDENPVYYIQYAHARICSMLAQSGEDETALQQASSTPLTAPSELALMRRLAEFPQMLHMAAQELAPHQVAFWLRECAASFHGWYNAERVLVEQVDLKRARLQLALATRQVLANGLALLGVSAPTYM